MNSLLRTLTFTGREYLSLGVNMPTNSLKILDTTEREYFELKLFQSDGKMWENYFFVHLSSLLHPLTCWLSLNVLTRSILGTSVTTRFAFYNFVNTSALRLIFIFKIFDVDCRNTEKNRDNTFGFEDNFIWIACVKNSSLLRQNIRHWKTIC